MLNPLILLALTQLALADPCLTATFRDGTTGYKVECLKSDYSLFERVHNAHARTAAIDGIVNEPDCKIMGEYDSKTGQNRVVKSDANEECQSLWMTWGDLTGYYGPIDE